MKAKKRAGDSYDGVPMDLEQFCSASKVVIVAGKGGVGKTTVTAAMAVVASRLGLRTLILEIEGKSGLSAMFGREPLGYEEMELAPGVAGRTLTPEQALLDYLDTHGLKRVSKRLVRSGAAEIISTAAPGIKDILVLGKVKSIERYEAHDLILIDAPAAGHAVTFLQSPRGLLDAVTVGPIRKQALDVIEMLSDPLRCRTVLVTLAEETPVNELVDTAFALEDRVGVSLAPVVVNGLYPDLGLDQSDVGPEAIEAIAERVDVFVSPREAADLAGAAAFHQRRRALQHEHVARLADRLPLRQIPLPFIPTTELGPDHLSVLADAFATGVKALPGPTEPAQHGAGSA